MANFGSISHTINNYDIPGKKKRASFKEAIDMLRVTNVCS